MVLFDCGEGSQRQLMISPVSFMKIRAIFISHMHGDHILGLPGLLQTMGLMGRKDPLLACGPTGFSAAVSSFLDACEGGIPYELGLTDMCGGDSVDMGGYRISAFEVEHGVEALGFVYEEESRRGLFDKRRAEELGLRPGPDFTMILNGETVRGVSPAEVIGPSRPGLRVVYSGDTAPCDTLLEAAEGADVLIHEATYASCDSELAAMHGHSTAAQAAETARAAGVKALMLTHISNRYDDPSVLEEEAKQIFGSTRAVRDLDMFTVSAKGVRSV